MTAEAWPDHPLTLEELFELPEDNSRRHELQEGVLVVSQVVREEAVSGAVPRLDADEALLAVEIISPGSQRTDTLVEPVEYAKAGIPYYWLIDLNDPLSLAEYHLPGDFDFQAAPAVTGTFTTTVPFSLQVDLTALPRPRA
ncbi:Uma2 family endonuclease [Actinophytocola oryzae]|uniref:Putative restriction endonuclease n=1 Tax=Actinophytocola oryzae TaxID=502181 RepID=A0A4R7UQ05_9PSEU|nr:Uma2 family endonuclease [Actinophytocola oryzae]TDV36059.1 putative restriction endonuclease [Actinophytocola oryzae]